MAEGMVNAVLGYAWEAHSAGTHPSGYVHPMAVRAMAEIGIDISTHRSKPVDQFVDVTFDRVVTVCDQAAKNCPAWLGEGRVKHIGFPDPAKAEGDQAQRMAVFRQVRDEIRERVLAYLRQTDDTEGEGFIYATGDV
jgi:arsenate reductase